MFTRGGIFIRNPRLMFNADDDASNGGGGENQDNAPKFPADTPVKDMTPEQQAAYHLHQSRKHEDRVKAFGDWTPAKIAALQKERDEFAAAGQTAEQKALEDAKKEGRTEVLGLLASERVKNAFASALAGRTPDASALLDLDRSTFANDDGTADVAAIKAWVDEHSTATGPAPKKAIDLGGGRNRGDAANASKGVGAGRDLFANRKKPTKQES